MVLTPNFDSFVLSTWYIIPQTDSLDSKYKSRVSYKWVNEFKIGTPYLQFLIIRTSNNHPWTLNIRNLSYYISMSILNSFNFITSSPIPKIQRFILRTTDYMTVGTIIKHSNCMLMLIEFTYFFKLRNWPHYGFTIPWTSHKMRTINEGNRRNSTIMSELKGWIALPIKTIYLAISAS